MKKFLTVILVIFFTVPYSQPFIGNYPKPSSEVSSNNDSTFLSFPSSHYTPHGYLDNPYHSMIFNRSGILRSFPPMGFGFWRTDFKGSYGEGPRDHQNYLSLLQIGITIDGHSFTTTDDFSKAGVELYSAYHTKNIFSYDWNYDNINVSIKYFLLREHSLVCIIELQNSGKDDKIVRVNGTHIFKIGDVKWWGSNGIASNYSVQNDAIISKIWAYGDIFVFGSDQNSVAHTSTESEKQWKDWLKSSVVGCIESASLMGKGPMHSLLSYNISVPAKSSRSLVLYLCRGKNEEWAKKEFINAKADVMTAFQNKINEDNQFWSQAPMLSGDWPETWKHGWVYDFETLRMNVRQPLGIYKHPWDAMQVSSPRVVLGETCMDMMTLSYSDPELAKKVLYGTFADAIAPNVPCSREDGSVNMVSADGSECGTAPMWGYPFHVIQLIFALSGDTVWVDSLYPYLKSYIEWWLRYRTDSEGWLHCNNSWESGQDGSKRFIVAEHNEGAVADFVRTVDVEASMAEAMMVMEKFADILGKKHDQENWKILSEQRIKNTHAMFFDNWFRDVDARNGKPILLKEYYDVMMLTPLACKVATPDQIEQVKPMLHYFASNRRLEWPPGVFTFTEAAWNAGEREIASQVVVSTANRVYERTDMKTILFSDSLFSYRIPGVANEFWPSDFVPAGGENYGWGATLPLYIIKNIIGFRESSHQRVKGFTLAPMLPKKYMQSGMSYTIRNLHYLNFTFDVTYTVQNENEFLVSLKYHASTPLSFSVLDERGKELYILKENMMSRSFTFDGVNGNVYQIRIN
ncbi:MAG: hypothetical protein A2455_11965 [Ignavibacteria bacterium RIFOXYC2_FULL_35_16]|nr:MAG: hypothetical protein A2X60_06215 [Ignavibacteria bacterium GWF2_35_20]OGU87813.1 MAG: hypothetical protein A2492_12635 [Ignavibacteria bacterium RIFOXYC12_FULL_35_11]OGU90893.1 MAG: hypothetical protein A3K31_07990 [Ignavibacteria bacterium RIFOXYA12_FULL_35_25]OGU96332.1 MAG: hypothetical protein A2347_05190 [Ignavibacteria bacterium RIFOXYB12_FULL_35_14]OGV01500.1 MAG: hypothetical protein A2455_11965 [Ignavibacteria bacterium RIFOXYC2_FULL_35_16]OGV31495.1 MAG: hypothetical protein 